MCEYGTPNKPDPDPALGHVRQPFLTDHQKKEKLNKLCRLKCDFYLMSHCCILKKTFFVHTILICNILYCVHLEFAFFFEYN